MWFFGARAADRPAVEVAASTGFQGNNPFVSRGFYGGRVALVPSNRIRLVLDASGSPFREERLKGLGFILVDRAYHGADDPSPPFSQPIDAMSWKAAAELAWTPYDAGIHLREADLAVRVSLVSGLEALGLANYRLTKPGSSVVLEDDGREVHLGPTVGIAFDLLPWPWLVVGTELRATGYVDRKPQYDPEIPVDDRRVVVPVVQSVSVGTRW
ncbi:MAG: hypothetical protein H6735_22950 [Alphaproteobacteria bacterium]|nr:hypothetical protein [Alphaproteobacteria bacterium]